jgi:phenylpyruvate tautomerase PptA (4-oxalocrotonate tautomerase family)
MPVTYLDIPEGLAVDDKRKLVKGISAALHAAYPFPDDVRIFLREWPLESVGQDGQLGSEPARPIFMMHVP